MKHLLFVFALLCAFLSHAAVINWGTGLDMNNIMSPTDPMTSLSGGTAYLIVGDASVANETLKQLSNGTWVPQNNGTMIAKSIDTTEGAFINSNSASGITGGDGQLEYASFADSQIGEQSMFIVTVDDTGRYFMVSSIATGEIKSPLNYPPDIIEWTIDALDDISGGWQQIGQVPEASSVLVALLTISIGALRRRKKVA